MQLASSNVQHQIQRAYGLCQRQLFKQAWQLLNAVSPIELGRFGAAGFAAECAQRVNALDDAESLFLLALQGRRMQDPEALRFRFNLALIYFQRQAWTPCIDQLKKVQQATPAHQRSAELLIQARLLRAAPKDIQQAVAGLRKQLMADPLNSKALQLWAETRWLQDEADWSTPYDTALTLPGHENLLVDYISKLTSLKLLNQAQQVLDTYAERYTAAVDGAHYQYCRALQAYQLGNADTALVALQKLPHNWLTSYAIEELYIKSLLACGDLEKALRLAQQRVAGGTSKRVEQGDWALLATALKFNHQSEAYRRLYDYDRFVKMFEVDCPPGFESIEEFHQSLIEDLDALHRDKNHPLNQSLRSGSQTAGHLFNQPQGTIEVLERAIRDQLMRYIDSLPDDAHHPFLSRKDQHILFTGAWSVKLREQGFHQNHFHNEGWISGCYYVQTPRAMDDGGEGWIKFGQMESEHTIDDTPDLFIRPHAGHVVFFPSYMWHGTNSFTDSRFRITVAFDLVPNR